MTATVAWGHAGLSVVVDVAPDRPATVRGLSAAGADQPVLADQPLVELLVAGAGRARASQRFSETAVGARLVVTGSEQTRQDGWHVLHIDQRDPQTGLAVRTSFRSADGVSGCQVCTEVTNRGPAPVLLLGLTSFAVGLPSQAVDRLDLVRGESDWLGEGRWTRRPLRDRLADLNLARHGQHGKGQLAVISQGTWSTGSQAPTGGLVDRETGYAVLWQIEHNGAWRWEVGERLDGGYLALLGPTDLDHQWQHRLAPGESFTTVPVSVAVSDQDLTGAVAALTAHRRALRRPHYDRSALPVVFNDYMNTLMGDPTTGALLPLIDAAAEVGAEVFCVDAGWYDNGAGSGWWDSVGEWQPSQTRFPRGIEEVLTRIRDHGMVPGLWLEPEVVGVRSPIADKLPPEAFWQRAGVRLVENGRYHLDLRHPRAVAHLDEVVDRLVEQLGIGYLKLDYNINPGPGTDLAADSPGAGLLGHNRAYLAWLDRLLDRHPGLILENCASGAMRADYALLARMQLQSTSDQQDHLSYPPIAAAAPMLVLPEQSASWAYPQPEMSDEELAYTVCTSLLGRLYLSGHIDRMSPRQRALVASAVTVYRAIRHETARAVPFWPLGLPGWTDGWIALGLRPTVAATPAYLSLWRRPGAPREVRCRLPHLAGRRIQPETVYPVELAPWTTAWDAGAGTLTVTADEAAPAARLIRLS
ncbi:MAG TPA: glycoside hydrolase family 36 protein [Natronosporangium sp.]